LINHGPRGKVEHTENFVPWKFDRSRNDSKHRNARYPDKIFDFDFESSSDDEEEDNSSSHSTERVVSTLVRGLVEYKHSGVLLDSPRISNKISIYDEVCWKNLHILSCCFLSVRRYSSEPKRFVFVCTLILYASKSSRKREKTMNILYDTTSSGLVRFDLSSLVESKQLEQSSQQDCKIMKESLCHYVKVMETKTDFLDMPHVFQLPPSESLAQVPSFVFLKLFIYFFIAYSLQIYILFLF